MCCVRTYVRAIIIISCFLLYFNIKLHRFPLFFIRLSCFFLKFCNFLFCVYVQHYITSNIKNCLNILQSEIMDIPVIGWAMKLAKHVFLKRDDIRSTLEVSDRCVERVSASVCVYVCVCVCVCNRILFFYCSAYSCFTFCFFLLYYSHISLFSTPFP